ncbi:MAG: DUF58 domain-containing protein [Myxococcota bacterium]
MSRRKEILGLRRRLRPPRRLRATRAGWCFVAIVFGVGFAALNTGNNLLYLVLALMLSFLVLSGLLSELSLRGIRIERRLPGELFAGLENRIVLRIHNDQKRSTAFAITLEDLQGASDGPEAVGRTFALRIGPREHVDRSYAWAPETRGDVRFDHVRVSTRFPFGLFVKSAEIDAPASALVYPQIENVSLRADETTGRERDERDGAAKRGDDLAGLREFVPGDGVGRVHWRRSLRSGRLLVGEREGEASGEIEVLVRASEGQARDAIEDRIRIAASEIVAHLDAGLRVGLRSPRVRIPPSSGAAHRREMLTHLARVEPEALIARPGAPAATEATRSREAGS